MRFANSRSISHAIRDDFASRAESGPNPRDRWPEWTSTTAFGLAPGRRDERPQLSADPSPRPRTSKGGGL